MRISEKTVKALQEIVNGDGALGIYRSGPVLVDFFNGFGRNDEYGRGFLLVRSTQRNASAVLTVLES